MKELVLLSLLTLWCKIARAQSSSTTTTSCSFTCVPADDCTSCGAATEVPDPADCERYYACITAPSGDVVPSDSSIACPSNYYFSVASGSCVEETTAGVCVAADGCNAILPTTTPSPTLSCSSTCPTDGTIESVADVHNCSLYYVCIDSNPAIHSSCPSERPYFDGEGCVLDQSKCCDFCTPYCSEAFVEIQDPCDCSSYYVCLSVGGADEDDRFTCPEGQYFDASIPDCVDGTCTNICSTC